MLFSLRLFMGFNAALPVVVFLIFFLSIGRPLRGLRVILGPHLRTPNLGFNPGLTPHICYIKEGEGDPRVEPRIWRPEMWALICFSIVQYEGFFYLAMVIKSTWPLNKKKNGICEISKIFYNKI
jgi:hypothetical protein